MICLRGKRDPYLPLSAHRLYLFRSQFTHIDHLHTSICIYLKSPCIYQLHIHLQSSSNSSSHPKLLDKPTPFHFALQNPTHPSRQYSNQPRTPKKNTVQSFYKQTLHPNPTVSVSHHFIPSHSNHTTYSSTAAEPGSQGPAEPCINGNYCSPGVSCQLQTLKSVFNRRCSIPALETSAPPNHNRRYFVRKCFEVPL